MPQRPRANNDRVRREGARTPATEGPRSPTLPLRIRNRVRGPPCRWAAARKARTTRTSGRPSSPPSSPPCRLVSCGPEVRCRGQPPPAATVHLRTRGASGGSALPLNSAGAATVDGNAHDLGAIRRPPQRAARSGPRPAGTPAADPPLSPPPRAGPAIAGAAAPGGS